MSGKEKCFFLDIDGTILPVGKKVPESAVEAIRDLRASGSLVFIATGRALSEFPDLSPLEFDGLVYSAGAAAIVKDKMVTDIVVPEAMNKELTKYFERRNLFPMFQCDSGTYMSEETYDLFYKYIGGKLDINGLKRGEEMPHDAKLRKYLVLSSPDGFPCSSISQELPEGFVLIPNTMGLPQALMCEIQLSWATKLSGIKNVMDYLGIDMKYSVAIGDGDNDVEMIAGSGIGIAMGNGCESAKKVATYVAKDIEDDGLADAIHYALRRI